MGNQFAVPGSATERFIKHHPEPRKLAYKPDLVVLCEIHDMLRFLCLEKGAKAAAMPAPATTGEEAAKTDEEVAATEPGKTDGGGTTPE